MPVIIPSNLPARSVLEDERIPVLSASRSGFPDDTTLQVAILNLMPTKIATETQLLRLLGASPWSVDITLFLPASHFHSKLTPDSHLQAFYRTFDQVRGRYFDGLIVTGAPVEHLPFESVDYWPELCEVFDWAETHARASFFICWAAQAALYHRYGIPKYDLPAKMFGVFPHTPVKRKTGLLKGFDDEFFAPHSRHTEIRAEDVEGVDGVEVLATSAEAGLYIVASTDERQLYVTGHSEYDPLTLKNEYDRDVKRGLPIAIPKNYYPGDDPTRLPVVRWRGHANLLYRNWLAGCVPEGGLWAPARVRDRRRERAGVRVNV